ASASCSGSLPRGSLRHPWLPRASDAPPRDLGRPPRAVRASRNLGRPPCAVRASRDLGRPPRAVRAAAGPRAPIACRAFLRGNSGSSSRHAVRPLTLSWADATVRAVTTRRILIGIAGGSGSGKTLVARNIVRELGADR